MNNPQSVGEQLLQLQNIAYIKQFMQKMSLKALLLITLLMTACSTMITVFIKDISPKVFDLYLVLHSSVKTLDVELNQMIMETYLTSSTIATLAVGLILPATLLLIIIRSASDNPSVIPLTAVKFLYLVSFIQTIIVAIPCVLAVVFTAISLFSADDIVTALISLLVLFVFVLIFCLYFVLQTKFLGAVKHSSTGYSLIYGSSSAFGGMSVFFAILSGISTAASVVAYIVGNSLISANEFDENIPFQEFVAAGGKEILLVDLKPVYILVFVLLILCTLYFITTAIIAFNYKNIVKLAIQEAFSTTKRQAVSVNSAFRTYGGQNSFKNYNYSASSGASQQSYAEIHKNITNNQNSDIVEEDDEPANPYESNPYNNYQGSPSSPVISEYNGSFPQNNMQNTPVQSGGSFGFQQDTSNNPYNE